MMHKNWFLKPLFISSFFIASSLAHAQPFQRLIYGEITLKNGSSYQGQIRWDNEEAMWENIFDAVKYEHPMQNLLPKDKPREGRSQPTDFRFDFMELWADKSPVNDFPFRCSFGDIASLTAEKDNIVLLTLKNGHSIKLKNKSGDLKNDILIYDTTTGRLKLDFDDIRSIIFSSVPSDLKRSAGDPIYGKMLTTMGVFEGYITWDLEECLGKDLISGKHKGSKIDILFEDIQTLKAEKDGSLITLKSGRTLFLNDHDDVDSGNHGIAISSLTFGTLVVEWEKFISATFSVPPASLHSSYNNFSPPQLLKGIVQTTNNNEYVGQIVYDLDEVYNIEFLNGENNGFKYYIPFNGIARIEPQNDKFSIVYLKDGQQFLLGVHADVTAANHGLIVKPKDGKAKYIEWKDIKGIQFE